MAKSKKSPKSSRSAKPSKAKKAGRVRLPILDALMAPLSGKRNRPRKARRVDETDALVAAAKVDVAKAEAPVRLTRMLSDPRLPAVGTEIVRIYKDREYRVVRQADCFIYGGREYPSLSKIAREIIGGAQVNGFAFFGLVKKPEAAPAS